MHNYIELALRTESIDKFKVDAPRVLHAALGLTTEFAELITSEDRTNLKEEIGDLLWYCAILADYLGLNFNEVTLAADTDVLEGHIHELQSVFFAIGEINDTIKRACFYGVELDRDRLAKNLGLVLLTIEYAIRHEKLTLEQCMEANIAKLKKRYPVRFTTEAAVNRDLEGEKEVLANG